MEISHDQQRKLNPSAKEFVPSSSSWTSKAKLSADAPPFAPPSDARYYDRLFASSGGFIYFHDRLQSQHRWRYGFTNQGVRRFNGRIQNAQMEECIRRTVYVSNIDRHVTEEQLAALFDTCGPIIDCRICGDAHSVLRFAFIEFADKYGAKAAINLEGTMLGSYPVSVLPSTTAILPVNPTFLPQSEEEREMCTRTVYCTNIDKKVTETEVRDFFESHYGEVSHLRLCRDSLQSTCIAFVEFVQADSAVEALNGSGMLLGSRPIRISPSKTPVMPQTPRATKQ